MDSPVEGVDTLTQLWTPRNGSPYERINPNGGEVDCANTFFWQIFLHVKKETEGLFLIHYELSENQKMGF